MLNSDFFFFGLYHFANNTTVSHTIKTEPEIRVKIQLKPKLESPEVRCT
jgi:hypothetical protein